MPSLNNFDTEQFLRHSWQQKPLLIRQGIENTRQLISPEELAGLACEIEMESRLISNQGNEWLLRHGPLTETDFKQLPDNHWTLLVQAVDHVNPAIAQLMEYFRFIPNWRLDDIMASYASKGGSVGPHFDNYDVFLVQTSGQREWQIGGRCDENSRLMDHPDLLLLDKFECQQRYVLGPGDILYIPPGYSHWGTALDSDCITCSIGFRAPAVADILCEYTDHLAQDMNPQQRFTDQNPKVQGNPGEIDSHVIDHLQSLLTDNMSDRSKLEKWFGQFMTTLKYEAQQDDIFESAQSIDDKFSLELTTVRDSASRFAFIVGKTHIQLYINGTCWSLNRRHAALAEMLCAKTMFSHQELLPWFGFTETSALLVSLFEKGCLYFNDY